MEVYLMSNQKKTFWKWMFYANTSLLIPAMFGYLGPEAKEAVDDINATFGPLFLIAIFVIALMVVSYLFCHALGIVTITAVTPTPVP